MGLCKRQLEKTVFPVKPVRPRLQVTLPELDAETGFKVDGQTNPVDLCPPNKRTGRSVDSARSDESPGLPRVLGGVFQYLCQCLFDPDI